MSEHLIERRVFERVEHAIIHQEPIAVTYVSATLERTTRVIEPYDIRVTAADEVIVRAMDRLRGEPRSFRMDRITVAEPEDGPCLLPRPTVDGEALRARLDDARALAAVRRIRAEIAAVFDGYEDTEMRWTPDCPVVTV